MDVKQQILQRLDELIAEAKSIITPEGRVDGATWDAWRVSAQVLVEQLTGKATEYYLRFAARATWVFENPERLFDPAAALTILERVRDDFVGGHIPGIESRVAGEVFTDFLDMTDHFLSEGYHPAAPAMVAGAVLEDFLRRLHGKRVVAWTGDSSISRLNNALRDRRVYELPTWRQVQAWGDIRNDADHGQFDKVDAGQVKLMVQGIRDFIAKHEG